MHLLMFSWGEGRGIRLVLYSHRKNYKNKIKILKIIFELSYLTVCLWNMKENRIRDIDRVIVDKYVRLMHPEYTESGVQKQVESILHYYSNYVVIQKK